MPPKRAPPQDRQKEFEPHERGDLRDMRDEWRLKKAVMAFARYLFIGSVGTVAAVVALRDQIVQILQAIASLIGGGQR